MLTRLAKHGCGARRDVGVGVDLPVRMMQRHTNRFSVVFKAEDLFDALHLFQDLRAIRPRFNDRAHTLWAHLYKVFFKFRAETNDLTASRSRSCLPDFFTI